MTADTNDRRRTEAIWKEVHDGLFAWIRRRVRSVEDAEDVLQEVFLRIHRHVRDLDDVENLGGWIHRIAANAITDTYRRGATRSAALARVVEQRGPKGETDPPEATEEMERRELIGCVEPLLRGIPVGYRQALGLTDLGGHTQTEAAALLGLSTSGMKTRVQRGRGHLKQALLDCCHFELDRRGGVIDYRRRDSEGCADCGPAQEKD